MKMVVHFPASQFVSFFGCVLSLFFSGTAQKSNIDTKNDGFSKCISFQIWRILGMHVSLPMFSQVFCW